MPFFISFLIWKLNGTFGARIETDIFVYFNFDSKFSGKKV